LAVAGADGQVGQEFRAQAFFGHGPGHDVDQLDAVADLGDGHAGKPHLQGLGDILGRQPEDPGPVLVHDQPDRPGLLVPIQVDVRGIGVGAHDVTDLIRYLPHAGRFGTDDTKLHGIADRWPQKQRRHAHPGLGDSPLGGKGFDACLDAVTGGCVRRIENDHAIAYVGKFRSHGQKPAGRARTDVAGVCLDFLIRLAKFFHFLHSLGRRLESGPGGQPHFNQKLRTGGGREELARHEGKADNGGKKEKRGQVDNRLAMGDAPGNETTQPEVDRRPIDGVRIIMADAMEIRQQLQTKIRRENNSHEPGRHQGDGHHPEDAARVFPGGGFRESDG